MDLKENNNISEETKNDIPSATEENEENQNDIPSATEETEENNAAGTEVQNTKPKKTLLKIIIIAVVSAFLLVSGIIVTTVVVLPFANYHSAISMREKNDFDGAKKIFEKLGGFRDSEEQLRITIEQEEIYNTEQLIASAQELFDNGEKLEAYRMLKTSNKKDMVNPILDEYENLIFDDIKKDFKAIKGDYNITYYPIDDTDNTMHCSYGVAGIRFYCIDTQVTDYSFAILMDTCFYGGFDSPILPQRVKFSNSKDSIELRIGYEERTVTKDYYWVEHIKTSISLEDFNKIIELLKDEEKITITISGHSLSADFEITEEDKALAIRSSDYINVLYEFHYRDLLSSDTIDENTTYEDAAILMLNIIDTIDKDGLTQSLVDEFNTIYQKTLEMETENTELRTQVNTVYNMLKEFYAYCLDPDVKIGESGVIGANELYIATYKNTSLYLIRPQIEKLRNMLPAQK